MQEVRKKERAIQLRKRGLSIRKIEANLHIPRSTLSGWLKNVPLTRVQRNNLRRAWERGLDSARQQAAEWKRAAKAKRLQLAQEEARRAMSRIDLKNGNVLDLALAMLYLGEGNKKALETGMGNTDPVVLRIFISILKKNYTIDVNKFRCELYLRADQNPLREKKFWSESLSIPLERFMYVHKDVRTRGTMTRVNYHGVCMVRLGNVAIQRKLLNISKVFCENIAGDMRP